jgi:hypothetical protein
MTAFVNIQYEQGDPPGNGKGRLAAAHPGSETGARIIPPGYFVNYHRVTARRCRDRWLENYLPYLDTLHIRSGSGPISGHYIAAARKAHSLFCTTCDPLFRFSAWRAVHSACQLFAQRSQRN